MSTTLLSGEDDHALLEAALAFLDSCSDNDSSSSELFDALPELLTTSDDSSSHALVAALTHSPTRANETSGMERVPFSHMNENDTMISTQHTRPTHTRPRRALSYQSPTPQPKPNAIRKCPRTEILQLREQISQLSTRLSMLQNQRVLAATATTAVKNQRCLCAMRVSLRWTRWTMRSWSCASWRLRKEERQAEDRTTEAAEALGGAPRDLQTPRRTGSGASVGFVGREEKEGESAILPADRVRGCLRVSCPTSIFV